MIDRKKLEQARAWARATTGVSMKEVHAAEEVIQSLPDEWVDADTLREVLQELDSAVSSGNGHQWDNGYNLSTREWVQRLKKLIPAPPTPRTLADMAPVERAECEWMQCDHPALEEPGVILQIWGNGCHVLSREGVVETEVLNHVTPRPDLPRMQWPGNEPDDVASATGGELTAQDVVDECRAVRKERATPEPAAPRPEDVFEFDPAYTYRDRDEAVWHYYQLNRMWICRDSRGWHVRADSVPPTRFGPYTRIEKENDHDQ